jgi:mannose-6-phosphate isomerase-like protein (cupin superfamily)
LTSTVRRFVTGHDPTGKAIFVSDDEVKPDHIRLLGDVSWLWSSETTPRFPDSGEERPPTRFFPPVGGFRFLIVEMPPEGAEPPGDLEGAAAEMEQRMPGLAGHMEPDNPGMHTSATVDFEIILRGLIILELDDGEERLLRPGDIVVQNGTRHRWRNAGAEPAAMAVVLIGAHHDAVEPR